MEPPSSFSSPFAERRERVRIQNPGRSMKVWVLCFYMHEQSKAAVEIFRQHGGVLRMSAALGAGVSRRTLYAMHADGILERLSRGVYRLTSLRGLEAPDLVAVTTRVPKGVVCP